NGRADAQATLQRAAGTARGDLGLAGFLDRAPRTIQITEPRFGRRQSARRARQQLDAEIVLELGDGFGNRWLPDAKLARRAGERAGLDDANEGFHRSQAIHPYSPWE